MSWLFCKRRIKQIDVKHCEVFLPYKPQANKSVKLEIVSGGQKQRNPSRSAERNIGNRPAPYPGAKGDIEQWMKQKSYTQSKKGKRPFESTLFSPPTGIGSRSRTRTKSSTRENLTSKPNPFTRN
jgi:hypothetical protein